MTGAMIGGGGLLGINSKYDSSVTEDVPDDESYPLLLAFSLAGTLQGGYGPVVGYVSGTAATGTGSAYGGRASLLLGPHDICSTAATWVDVEVGTGRIVGSNATSGNCVYGLELGASHWTYFGDQAETALEVGYGRAYDGRISVLARWYPETKGWGGYLDLELWRAERWGFSGRTQLGFAIGADSRLPAWLGFELGFGGPLRSR